MKSNLTFLKLFPSFLTSFSTFLKISLVLFSLLGFKLFAYDNHDNEHSHNEHHHSSEMRIMASIEPLAALVQSVVADLTEVKPLIDSNSNLHTHIIKVSDMRKIQNSDVFFSIHPNMEMALHKALINQDKVQYHPLFTSKYSSHQIEGASEYLNLQLTQLKQEELELSNEYDSHHNEHNHHQVEEHHQQHLIDYHIWLDPIYAKVMLDKIAQILGEHYPVHQATFIKNALLAKQEIDETNQKIRSELTQFQDKAFLVYHDAYQYFVNHYDLNQVGYIATETGSLSIRKIIELREVIDEKSVSCLFSEKQYFDAKKTIEMIAEEIEEDRELNITLLNPIHTSHSYSNLLLSLSASFRSCLQS